MRGTLAIGGMLLCLGGSADARDPRSKVVPEDPPPWQLRPLQVRIDVVRTLLEQGSAQRALELLAAFKAEGIDSPDLDLLQGIALRETGMNDQAEQVLLKARSQLGRDSRPNAELCVLYADAKRVDEAIDSCDRAVGLDRSSPRAWNNYGWMLLAANRPADALEAFDQAIHLDGSQERYRNNLAFAQVALDQLAEAERTFRTTGSHADAAYNVGVALLQGGRRDDARSWFRSALAYDPTHEPAREALDTETPPSLDDDAAHPTGIGPSEESP